MAIHFDIDIAYLVGDWLEAVLWGVYSVLFAVCMRSIWKKRRTELFHFTTIVLILMYLFATAHISLSLRRLIEGFVIYRDTLDPQLYFATITRHVNDAKDWFYVALMVLGDSIIVWRCFIVWNRSFLIIILPCLMLTATAVGGLGAVISYSFTNADYAKANDWAEAMFISSLITNVTVTSLTASRIWYRSRGSSQFFAGAHSGYTRVLLLVVESGLSLLFVKAIEFGFWLDSPADGLNGDNAIYVLYESVVPIEGIVPTAMILSVVLGYTSRKTYAVETTPNVSFRTGASKSTNTLTTNSYHLNELAGAKEATGSFSEQKVGDQHAEIGTFAV